MKKLPIIAFAPHPWHEPEWMNRQQLLTRLGKRGWPVVYSNGSLNIWQRQNTQWKQATWLGAVEKTDNVTLYHSGKFFPRWQNSQAYDQLAIQFHSFHLKRSLALSYHDTSFITLAFHPAYWPYVKSLNSKFVAFHIYDLYSKMHRWDDSFEKMYQNLLDRADIITASSEAMVEKLSEKHLNKVKILHNGVDTDLFRDVENPCPEELKPIPHPRIMSIGTINRKIDLPLIVKIAKLKPKWHWVFVGNLIQNELVNDTYSASALSEFNSLKNIHYLGERSRLDIPPYIQHSDVNVICYRIRDGEWVAAGYPLKLNEYLSTGKPVIASPMDAIKRYFTDVVDIADSSQQWIIAIEKALSQGGVGTPLSRIATSKLNSWDNRVDNLESWLLEIIQ